MPLGFGLGSFGGMPGQASIDLGLGSMLVDQVTGESEEQRKRRMAELQARQQGPGAAMSATPAGQLAALSLFGGAGGFGAR